MIQFYTEEVGIDLVFPLKDFNGNPLTDPPLAGWPKMFVKGLPTSPITLQPTSTPGSYHHVTAAGEWPVLAGEVIHFYEAHIEWRSPDGREILTDAFRIAVIKELSLSL